MTANACEQCAAPDRIVVPCADASGLVKLMCATCRGDQRPVEVTDLAVVAEHVQSLALDVAYAQETLARVAVIDRQLIDQLRNELAFANEQLESLRQSHAVTAGKLVRRAAEIATLKPALREACDIAWAIDEGRDWVGVGDRLRELRKLAGDP